jgi:hypothetical protein
MTFCVNRYVTTDRYTKGEIKDQADRYQRRKADQNTGFPEGSHLNNHIPAQAETLRSKSKYRQVQMGRS